MFYTVAVIDKYIAKENPNKIRLHNSLCRECQYYVHILREGIWSRKRFVHESGQYAEMETGGTTLSFTSNELAKSNLPEGFQKNDLAHLPAGIEIAFTTDDALALRAQYSAVQSGYYMNKMHWNTITLDGSISDEQILEMIDGSFELVVKGLKKADRQELKQSAG